MSRGRLVTASSTSLSMSRASCGSATVARSSTSSTIASVSTPAGIDSPPIKRQRCPTRATSATDEVADPRSRARKALGSLVTDPCYP